MGAEYWGSFTLGVINAALLCFGFYVLAHKLLGNNIKFLKFIGVECMEELSEEKKLKINQKVDSLVEDFIEDWNEGNTWFAVALSKVGVDFQDDLMTDEYMSEVLSDIIENEALESVKVLDGYLLLDVSLYELYEVKKRQYDEWRKQGQLERAEYHNSRGVY